MLERLAARVTTGGGEREPIEVDKPATGELLGIVPRCTAEDGHGRLVVEVVEELSRASGGRLPRRLGRVGQAEPCALVG